MKHLQIHVGEEEVQGEKQQCITHNIYRPETFPLFLADFLFFLFLKFVHYLLFSAWF